MTRYKALDRVYINDQIYEAGATFTAEDGLKGKCIEAVSEASAPVVEEEEEQEKKEDQIPGQHGRRNRSHR